MHIHGEYFLAHLARGNYNNKHELPVAAMFVNGSGGNEQSL
jgi:hypothetical protein